MEIKFLKKWTMPGSYCGELWPDYYQFLGRHRDSSIMDNCNFAEALLALGGESETVLVVREGHWAVGWVEWIAIHDSDNTAIEKAEEILQRLEDYPILNEDKFSEMEYESACDYWDTLDEEEKQDLCQEYQCTYEIDGSMPRDDDGRLFDYLRGE